MNTPISIEIPRALPPDERTDVPQPEAWDYWRAGFAGFLWVLAIILTMSAIVSQL